MKTARLLPIVAALFAPVLAHAEDAAPAAAATPAPAAPVSKIPGPTLQDLLPETEKRTVLTGWVEAGITYNPQSPIDNQNFGRLFDDRNDGPQLNQVAVNAERVLVPVKGEWDWGFKIQGIYGSDARYTRSLGLGDQYGTGMAQLDLVEGYASLHAPVLTEGGMDFKVGKFATMNGLEVIDPRGNFFYSHSYIFNFGPFTHTGVLATINLPEGFTATAGVIRGLNSSFDDNNKAVTFHGGAGYATADGKLTINAATCIGPETNDDNSTIRSFTNVVTVYKLTSEWTLSSDMSYMQDNAGTGAKAYGIAGYATYAISDTVSLGLRAEVFRDQNGFFVAQQGANDDFIDLQRGIAKTYDPRTVGGGKTTYGSVTLGVNWKIDPRLTIRPEVRYDRSLNDTTPFNTSGANRQGTVAVDAIFTF